MHISRRFPVLAAGAFLGLSAGCAPGPSSLSDGGDRVVAEVGEQRITQSELDEYQRRVPEHRLQAEAPRQARRELLESLIDKIVLLQEAQATGVEADPWFTEQMDQERRTGLLALYRQRQIVRPAATGEEAPESAPLQELAIRRRAARVDELLDSLALEYRVQVHQDALRMVSRWAGVAPQTRPTAADADTGMAVCTYSGGTVTLSDLLREMRRIGADRVGPADSAQVADVLRHVVLPARLFALAAASAGLEQDPVYLASQARRREELLLAALYRRVMDAHVPVTDAEERAYYDAYPERFTSPPTTVAVEILVAADTLAERLKAELQAGADAEMLARQYSIRPGAVVHDGRIRLNEYNRSAFPGVYEAVADLQVGQVGGPVPTAAGYSVVKVVDRRREKAPYDEQTRRLARSHVRAEKGRQEYARYVRELRGRYRVIVHEENLAR